MISSQVSLTTLEGGGRDVSAPLQASSQSSSSSPMVTTGGTMVLAQRTNRS